MAVESRWEVYKNGRQTDCGNGLCSVFIGHAFGRHPCDWVRWRWYAQSHCDGGYPSNHCVGGKGESWRLARLGAVGVR